MSNLSIIKAKKSRVKATPEIYYNIYGRIPLIHAWGHSDSIHYYERQIRPLARCLWWETCKWVWKAGALRNTLQELHSVQQSKKSEDWASGWLYLKHLYWCQIHQPIHQKYQETSRGRRSELAEQMIRARWRCNGADRSLNGTHPLIVLFSWTCGPLILLSEEPLAQQPDLKESTSLLCPPPIFVSSSHMKRQMEGPTLLCVSLKWYYPVSRTFP